MALRDPLAERSWRGPARGTRRRRYARGACPRSRASLGPTGGRAIATLSETSSPSDLEARFRTLPKVELHQHVDGSIPPEVTWELMRRNRLNPVDTLDEMRRRLEIQEGEQGTLLAYLDKMHYPLWITQFYENISRVTEAIVDAAAAAGVVTLELRYSPVIHTYAGL